MILRAIEHPYRFRVIPATGPWQAFICDVSMHLCYPVALIERSMWVTIWVQNIAHLMRDAAVPVVERR